MEKNDAMVTEQTVRDALQGVLDPELGVSVVDLGMIREIVREGKFVEIRMVLTAPFCPLANLITDQVRRAVEALPGVEQATVTLLDEPWHPAGIQ